jgi:subtilisin family serine protease
MKTFCTNPVGAALVVLLCLGSFGMPILDAAETTPTYFHNGGKCVPFLPDPSAILVCYKGTGTKSVGNRSEQSVSRRGLSKTAKIVSLRQGVWEKIAFSKTPNKAAFSALLADLNAQADVAVASPALRIPGSKSPLLPTDRFIVQFKPDTTPEKIAEMAAIYGVEAIRSLDPLPKTFLYRATGEYDAIQAANAYAESGCTVFAHPDFLAERPLRAVPNDPLYASQWHLDNTGQNGATAGEDIDAPEAWDTSYGDSNVVVAIPDSGIQISHPDLADRIVSPWDAIDNDNDPSPVYASETHGTSAAGLICASNNNEIGVTGVAPWCSLMPIRLILNSYALPSDEAEAFLYASDNGADIITNSWGPFDNAGYGPLFDVTRTAIDYATRFGRGGKGCIILFASGNGNEDIETDGYTSYEKVLAVGATTNKAKRAGYSDYGAGLDVCAPGGDSSTGGGLWTTDMTGSDGYGTGDYLGTFCGTSGAAPIAAGVCALILSSNPDLTRQGVTAILEDSADKIDATNGNYLNGHSVYYGYGRVNARSAVERTVNRTDMTGPAQITDFEIAPSTFEATWTTPSDIDSTESVFSYEMRYSFDSNLSAIFDTTDAIDVTRLPAPQVAGTSASFFFEPHLNRLTAEDIVNVGLVSYDRFGNRSAISNVATFEVPPIETIAWDDFERLLGQWTLSGNWATSTVYADTGSYSLCDNSTGVYTNNMTSSAILGPVDLTDAYAPFLRFRERFNIEYGYDYGAVEVGAGTSPSAVTWSDPIWISSGSIDSWRDANVDLSDWADLSNVYLRFYFYADATKNGSGWYIDNLFVEGYDTSGIASAKTWEHYDK